MCNREREPQKKKDNLPNEWLYISALTLLLFVGVPLFSGDVYAQYGNCTECHDMDATGQTPKINVTAINQSIHRDVNNYTSLSLPAGAPNVTKACWACHGNGTEPTGTTQADHDSWPNLRNAWNCSDCHTNKTGGYNPSTGIGNYSAPIIYEHFNGTDVYYAEDTTNTTINITAQCWDCHNRSVRFNEDGADPQTNVRSNVSHYGTNTSLNPGGYNTTNCTTCHKNATVALQWNLRQTAYVNYTIRHSENNATFCGKCHNSTSADNLHAEKLYLPYYVHKEYDWEDDDANEAGPTFKYEACVACHNDTGSSIDTYPRRICEDCHLNGSTGPYDYKDLGPSGADASDFQLRSDWQESIPFVYSHIFENATYTNTTGDVVNVTGVEVSTGNVSELIEIPPLPPYPALRNSTCLAWSNVTQEGACHGVPSSNTSDGYYAFSNKSGDVAATDESYYPYYYNAPVDYLPDTTNCTYCHQGNASVRRQWGNATNISEGQKRSHPAIDTTSNSKCRECHTDNGTVPYNFHSLTVNNGTGGPDCVGCHDIGRSHAPDVDVASMNASSNSVHQNLSNTTANTTALADMVDKACWRCHGNGSQPPPGQHPANYRNPLLCEDCHTNKTGGYNEATGKGNFSAPIITEHLNGTDAGYQAATINISINTTAQCWECHTNSAPSNDTENGTTMNNSAKSNASHYSTTGDLTPGENATTDCTTCHMNATLALQWGLRQTAYVNYTIRHSDDNATFCGKCHNSTNVGNLHAKKLYVPWYVHDVYDWEDDDGNDGPPLPEWESCFACHNEIMTGTYPPRICEDCHLNGSIGPYNDSDPDAEFSLRSDWNESMPYVFEHIFENATYTNTTGSIVNVTGVGVNTGNVSELIEIPPLPPYPALRNSTCLAWSNVTQEGACHGVPSSNTSDGYYAFSNTTASNNQQDFNLTNKSYFPYRFNAPVDWLPDTRNCTYCHQGNASVRWQWGNISYNSEHHYVAKNNSQCYECHVVGGQRPFNFHAKEMHSGTGPCRFCHTDKLIMSKYPSRQYAFVNESQYNQSVHGNQSVIDCEDCHTVTSNATANHTGSNYYPPQSGLKWCEDCHVVNQSASDPMSHNITSKPQYYNVTYEGQSMSVLNVTDCTACHDATMFNTASATFNRTSGKDCRFCHTFPEREPESPY